MRKAAGNGSSGTTASGCYRLVPGRSGPAFFPFEPDLSFTHLAAALNCYSAKVRVQTRTLLRRTQPQRASVCPHGQEGADLATDCAIVRSCTRGRQRSYPQWKSSKVCGKRVLLGVLGFATPEAGHAGLSRSSPLQANPSRHAATRWQPRRRPVFPAVLPSLSHGTFGDRPRPWGPCKAEAPQP